MTTDSATRRRQFAALLAPSTHVTYASLWVPTERLPNRAFACAATSQGHMDDKTHTFTCPSIFGLLSQHSIGWAVYGYDADPLTRGNFPDIHSAPSGNFGRFTDFQTAANGALPAPSVPSSIETPGDDVLKVT